MKLIIDIPEDYLKGEPIQNGSLVCKRILEAVYKGTPLDDIKAEIEQDGAYYQEIGEKERASAYLEILSTIDKYIGKVKSEEENNEGNG